MLACSRDRLGRKRELVALALNLVGIAVLPLQVLSIDAHNKGWNSAAVLLAVARPGWEDAGCSYSFQALSPTLKNRGSLMACKTAGCLITVVQEVVRRSRPGRGPLELSCQVRRDGGWELLYRWADQAHSVAADEPASACSLKLSLSHAGEKLSLEHPTSSSPGTLRCTSVIVNRKPKFPRGFRGA